ncbi:type I restriction endonuclease subunit R [Patescibacteria group bacterium]
MPILANFDEAKQSQLPLMELLLNMGYKYIPIENVMLERDGNTSKFILKNILFNKMRAINTDVISDKSIKDAIDWLENIQLEGLIDTSKDIYNVIMKTGGKTVTEIVNGKRSSQNLRFIDFENPKNNDFSATVEFEVSGKANIRPDIVLFVNGIPFAVIENKKSSVDVIEALDQMNRNQGLEYCPKFFAYPQLLIGTNGKDLRYGATGTPNKFYSKWREKEIDKKDFDKKIQDLIKTKIDEKNYSQICKDLNGATKNHKQLLKRLTTDQDRGVVSLLEPARLLNLTKNFILYDAGVKKISRYQQFFAINKMLKTVEEEKQGIKGKKRKGGLIWHTQGSGKSLTMVMFVKALIENPKIVNPRVIVVSDRVDLGRQISNTFRNCKLKKRVVVARTGSHLLQLIKNKEINVVTTLVQKFESARKYGTKEPDYDKNIFVLIDEAHRTQGGIANAEMNKIIPNACFIGFTGTPLMKKEKASVLKFGGYIDKYTIDDALADKVILPLIYEGRYVEMSQNEEKINLHTDRIAYGSNKEQKRFLQGFVNDRIIKSNPHRIGEIAYDIEKHYINNFQNSGLKAQIVAPSKFSAILFQKFFEDSGKINSAVIISDMISKEYEEYNRKKEVIDFLKKIKRDFRNLKSYEETIIDSFKNNPDGIEIIIVVDKLLTGFDAPRNTALYLAKDLHDHNLLQAIARVNRLFENKKIPKTSGFIIDYSENAKNLDTAMKLFGSYDDDDVKSALIDVQEKINELEKSYDSLNEIFKEQKNSKDDEAYIKSLEDEQEREQFYKAMNDFMKNFNECLALENFVHKFKHLDVYKMELKKFLELRRAVRLRYADTKDFSEYKTQLVKILDQYVDAEAVELMTKQINIHDSESFTEAIDGLGSDKSKAEAIEAQIQKTITEKAQTDPEFYNRFSDKIKKIIEEMRKKKMEDLEALKQLKEAREEVLNKKDDLIPNSIKDNEVAGIFYRNLKGDFEKYDIYDDDFINIVIDVYKILKKEAIVDWHKNSEVKRVIQNKIDDYLYDEVIIGKNIKLDNDSTRSILDKTINLAIENNSLF